jgi:hypothetical protein
MKHALPSNWAPILLFTWGLTILCLPLLAGAAPGDFSRLLFNTDLRLSPTSTSTILDHRVDTNAKIDPNSEQYDNPKAGSKIIVKKPSPQDRDVFEFQTKELNLSPEIASMQLQDLKTQVLKRIRFNDKTLQQLTQCNAVEGRVPNVAAQTPAPGRYFVYHCKTFKIFRRARPNFRPSSICAVIFLQKWESYSAHSTTKMRNKMISELSLLNSLKDVPHPIFLAQQPRSSAQQKMP